MAESTEKSLSDVFGLSFQSRVIKLMLVNKPFCAKAVQYLRPDYFAGEFRWFFKKVSEFYQSSGYLMPAEVLQTEIYKHGENTLQYQKLLADILSQEMSDPVRRHVEENVTGFIRANLFVSTYRQVSMIWNSGSKEDAYSFTKKAVGELVQVDFQKSKVAFFGDSEEVCNAAANQSRDAIPTGIKPIDDAMFGGMMPQTWTTFLGGSNVGKSILCPNLAYHAVSRGKKTFVTVHEDEELPTKLRYLARFSGLSYNRLTQPRSDWTKEEKDLVGIADEILRKNVFVRFMYGSECFLENVTDAVRQAKDEFGIDQFLCDYGQCLKVKAFKSMEDKYSVQEYIYQELKQVCQELYIAGAGGAQANRQGHKINKAGSDFLRCTDVGDSWGIVKKSSNVVTMNRSDTDVQYNRITFLLDKVRNGRCPVAVQCVTDYSRMITHVEYREHERTQQEISVDGKTEDAD